MNYANLIRIALRALANNKFRGFLTMLGIIIGVGSYLNYAEAANEAWGPTGTGLHGYSAYDVIKGHTGLLIFLCSSKWFIVPVRLFVDIPPSVIG